MTDFDWQQHFGLDKPDGEGPGAYWANDHVRMAVQLLQRGDHNRAFVKAVKAIEADPLVATSYVIAALSLSHLDKTPELARVFQDEDDPEAYMRAALMHEPSEQEQFTCHGWLGHAALDRGAYEEAHRHLQKAAALDGNDAYVTYSLARVMATLNLDFGPVLTHAIRLNPESWYLAGADPAFFEQEQELARILNAQSDTMAHAGKNRLEEIKRAGAWIYKLTLFVQQMQIALLKRRARSYTAPTTKQITADLRTAETLLKSRSFNDLSEAMTLLDPLPDQYASFANAAADGFDDVTNVILNPRTSGYKLSWVKWLWIAAIWVFSIVAVFTDNSSFGVVVAPLILAVGLTYVIDRWFRAVHFFVWSLRHRTHPLEWLGSRGNPKLQNKLLKDGAKLYPSVLPLSLQNDRQTSSAGS